MDLFPQIEPEYCVKRLHNTLDQTKEITLSVPTKRFLFSPKTFMCFRNGVSSYMRRGLAFEWRLMTAQQQALSDRASIVCFEHLPNTSVWTEDRTFSVTPKRLRRWPLLDNSSKKLLPLLGNSLYIIVYVQSSPNVFSLLSLFKKIKVDL